MGIPSRVLSVFRASNDSESVDPLEGRRARSVQLGSLAMLALAVPFVFQYWRLGMPSIALLLAAGIPLSLLNLALLRRTGRARLHGNVTIVLMALINVGAMHLSGGTLGPNVGALHLLPIAGFAWLGARGGWSWTALTATILVAFWWLDASADPVQATLLTSTLIRRLGALTGVALLAAAFLAIYERQEKSLVEERQQLQDAVAQSRHAEQAAEREAQAQATFVATVSHELRTPMNAALGSAALLMDTELSAEQRRFVRTIHHSGQALLDVVDDILDYSKIQAGALRLEHAELSLRDVLETVAEMLAPLAHAKGLELVCDLAANLPERSLGDAARLRQIVLNLLSNALKFTRRGEITLRAHRSAPGRVEIVVQDSGVGMSQAQAERVFDPFVQAESSTAGRYGGTGLGLTISQRLAKLMDGDVRVTAAVGEGATFRVSVALDELEPARTQEAPRLPHGVLVVDPHPGARTQLAHLLKGAGLRHELAADAQTAAHLLSATPFDAVLVEATLASEVTRRVQERARRDVRIVVLRAAGAVERDAQRPLDQDFLALHKPVRRDALLRALSGRGESLQGPPQGHSLRTGREVREDAPLVLVAEDNAPSAELARQMVQRHGYRCETVRSGGDVLARLSRGGVAIVLMDCQMPGMDGFEAARRARRQHAKATLPIVAVTAHTSEADRRHVLDAGMDDFLTKPYTLSSLGAVLGRWCPLPEASVEGEATRVLRPSGEIPSAYDLAFERLREYVPADQPAEETLALLDRFLKESEARTGRLRNALDSELTDAMQREAHALRGSLGFLGLLHACDLCTELTSLTLPDDQERARACVDRLEQGLGAIRWSRQGARLATA